jgi:hypothetical protein
MFESTRKIVSFLTISLTFMGVFALPGSALAETGWYGSSYGYGYNNYGYNNYSYDPTDDQHTGEIQLNKKVRDVTRNQGYGENITVRSGSLVEVRIEVKNKSSRTNAVMTVQDEISGNMVYVPNSIRLNSQSTQAGLTSGNFRINLAANSTAWITYQMYVCGSSGYAMRATAYAAGLGSGTDAVIVNTEYQPYGQYDHTYTCMNQFQTQQNSGSSSANATTTGNTSAGIFGTWTGVNNSQAISQTVNNPFGDWTGVSSSTASASTSANTQIGHTPGSHSAGYSNNSAINNSSNNIFGTWTGVNNSQAVSNPFGDWTGVSASGNNNPFGDWTGVSGTSATGSAAGYTGAPVAYIASADNYYVAPTTGVDKLAPFGFASLLLLGFLAYRKRKWLFT